MILVAGSTGNLGSEIVRQLRERGEEARGLVRATSAPEKVEPYHRSGGSIPARRGEDFEEAVGKPLTITEVPEQALESQWSTTDNPFEKTFSGLMLGVARLDEPAKKADGLPRRERRSGNSRNREPGANCNSPRGSVGPIRSSGVREHESQQTGAEARRTAFILQQQKQTAVLCALFACLSGARIPNARNPF